MTLANAYEELFVTLIIVFGQAFLGFLIGNIVVMIERATREATRYAERMEEVNELISMFRVDTNLAKRIKDWAERGSREKNARIRYS